MLNTNDSRITKESILFIKAQQFHTQEKNKADAFERLQEFITKAIHVNPTRRPTKSSRNARLKQVDQKTQRGKNKSLRGKVNYLGGGLSIRRR